MKTEPGTYSWDDLVQDGKTEWTGVRNFAARNNMRNMNVGDEVFIYHSGDNREIVGIAQVIAPPHPDSTDTTGMWDCVDIAPVKPLARPVTLSDVKKMPDLKTMVLVTRGRLSVQSVTEKEWKIILNSGTASHAQ